MGETKEWLKTGTGKIVAYFLQGLLLTAPVFVTIYVIVYAISLVDTHLNNLFESIFHFRFFGFGLLITLAIITFIGFIGSLVIVQPFLHLIDLLLEKTPFVKDLYSSLKDFFGAFISNKKKFNQPVMFEMGKGSGVFKVGFVTKEDMGEMGVADKVAVYTPLSYNLSGILYLVNKDQVVPMPDVSARDVMKFIVSGGLTEIDEDNGSHNS
ncbi:MAG TPA: DUF502 domain-containing protein [Chitinophagales bacterium]|nr:DUF502 domain-containing protein [Chitinophagales bacterium]